MEPDERAGPGRGPAESRAWSHIFLIVHSIVSAISNGGVMLAISQMGATPQAIFYVVGVILFILAGIGFKPAGDRVHLVGLGLAAVFFVVAWNALAAT
jgi:hypothetical protein